MSGGGGTEGAYPQSHCQSALGVLCRRDREWWWRRSPSLGRSAETRRVTSSAHFAGTNRRGCVWTAGMSSSSCCLACSTREACEVERGASVSTCACGASLQRVERPGPRLRPWSKAASGNVFYVCCIQDEFKCLAAGQSIRRTRVRPQGRSSSATPSHPSSTRSPVRQLSGGRDYLYLFESFSDENGLIQS